MNAMYNRTTDTKSRPRIDFKIISKVNRCCQSSIRERESNIYRQKETLTFKTDSVFEAIGKIKKQLRSGPVPRKSKKNVIELISWKPDGSGVY